MDQNFYTPDQELEGAGIVIQGDDNNSLRETCEQEHFNRSYFNENFLGVYFKVFELATIFFRQ